MHQDIKNMTLQKHKQVTSLDPILPSNKDTFTILQGWSFNTRGMDCSCFEG